MDSSKLTTFTLTIVKQGPFVNANLNATTDPTVASPKDLFASVLLPGLQALVTSDPGCAGYTQDPKQSKTTINTTQQVEAGQFSGQIAAAIRFQAHAPKTVASPTSG